MSQLAEDCPRSVDNRRLFFSHFLKFTVLKKRDGLFDDGWIEHHERMRHVKRYVICHAFDFGAFDRDFAVIVAGDQGRVGRVQTL